MRFSLVLLLVACAKQTPSTTSRLDHKPPPQAAPDAAVTPAARLHTLNADKLDEATKAAAESQRDVDRGLGALPGGRLVRDAGVGAGTGNSRGARP